MSDAAKFIPEWSGPYKPHIVQKPFYGEDNVEPGEQRATLNQSLARALDSGEPLELNKSHGTHVQKR